MTGPPARRSFAGQANATQTDGRRPTISALHAIVSAASRECVLPSWARCSDRRLAHAIRVGDLLREWAMALRLNDRDLERWRAAGILHDALKDASRGELRDLAGSEWPDAVAHAPACATRLERDGVRDRSLLAAIAYHPVGHPDLDDLGEFLILADYLEPGRDDRDNTRSVLRGRLPGERDAVLREVLAVRIGRLLDRRSGILACTVEHWNRVVER